MLEPSNEAVSNRLSSHRRRGKLFCAADRGISDGNSGQGAPRGLIGSAVAIGPDTRANDEAVQVRGDTFLATRSTINMLFNAVRRVDKSLCFGLVFLLTIKDYIIFGLLSRLK